MGNTCDLIELYSNGKISLDGLFAELESGCSLDNNQIIEYCSRQISSIDSSLEKSGLYYAISEIFILATFYEFINIFIQNKFAIDLHFFSSCWIFLLIYLVWVNTITPLIFSSVLNLFFKNKFCSIQRLEDLKRHYIELFTAPCSNCVYYHGKSYNGNYLICAVHSYGKEDCPDFESK